MRDDKKKELKNLFISIGMSEFADWLDDVIAEWEEYIPYFRNLLDDAKQARDTTTGDTFLKYRHKAEALEKIIELFMLFA